MVEEIPTWATIPLITILTLIATYLIIRNGYNKDMTNIYNQSPLRHGECDYCGFDVKVDSEGALLYSQIFKFNQYTNTEYVEKYESLYHCPGSTGGHTIL